MVYRRKAPPAAQLSTLQQLQLLCNATAAGLSFQVYNAQALLSQFKIHNPTTFEQFTKNATRQEFFSSRLFDGSRDGALMTGAPAYALPLPKHFIDPTEAAESLVQRVFYHGSAVKSASELRGGSYFPRCGLTGSFFSREEVVDNLQAAAAELEFKSPFWIRSDHPALGDFLHLKDGSEAICLSLTAAVVSLEDVGPFDEELLHPLLRRACRPNGRIFEKDVPLGMNALSGFITKNPFVQQLPNRGVWLSQDQVLLNGLQLRKKKGASSDNPFVFVEVEQWEMHNADQLTVPGRLALHKPLSKDAESTCIFS
ncbi:hypothetical protein DQ04_03551000 [Trypanosoma grayi]|uniref:hypothetical protein n=1 Tax=Trypanosoma grayi TaxID=71804 RepID=UPI0004F46B9F|nr:hypothetical protein DQ04_03551000 [Trypanosoma grayi]KEG10569.1 hypothetical protein DQ04_03551000 [Trypanosoma grayi]